MRQCSNTLLAVRLKNNTDKHPPYVFSYRRHTSITYFRPTSSAPHSSPSLFNVLFFLIFMSVSLFLFSSLSYSSSSSASFTPSPTFGRHCLHNSFYLINGGRTSRRERSCHGFIRLAAGKAPGNTWPGRRAVEHREWHVDGRRSYLEESGGGGSSLI